MRMSLPILLLLSSLPLAACDQGGSPEHDTAATATVTDPYLWLEDVQGEKALDWVRKQNQRSLALLEGDPRFAQLNDEALAILGSKARLPLGDIHGQYVYNFWQDDQHVRGIWRRATLNSYAQGAPDWATLLDVDALAQRENENWVYKGYQCLTPKFDRCMISLSRGGTDAAVWREYAMNRRAFTQDGFVLPEAKTSVAWVDADTLLVATDWGDGLTQSGYPHTVKRWRRGTPLQEATEVYRGQLDDVGVFSVVDHDNGEAFVFSVRAITFFASEYRWHRYDGSVTVLPLPQKLDGYGLLDGRYIVTLEEDWAYQGAVYPQGSLVALRLQDMQAELVFAPGAGQAINNVAIGESSLIVELLDHVIGTVQRFTRGDDGWQASVIGVPPNGVVKIASVNDQGDDFLLSFESLTTPNSLLYVAQDNAISDVMSLPEMYDASDVVVEQRFATSKDGTRVPYFVMARKEVLARGDAPTVQYGYGGFLVPVLPVYYEDPARPQHGALAGRMWVARGGVLVLSNIRGGSEYGPAWHAAALKLNRHKSFEDFFAISEALIRDGVTTPAKLGAIGRSNGGLLMGVALTQRPDLYAAIDCGVPLLDMLRYHKLLAGASWTAEFGNPDVLAEREYLAAYSPYQHLRKDAQYPTVFFYTSTKDDRVHPGHARKMAARMLEYDHPFLYYENIEGGHGGTANQPQLAKRTALEWLFFLRELTD